MKGKFNTAILENMVGWFLMHPGMVYDDLSWPLPTLGKARISF
jgi:hypothetical protein